MQIKFLIKIFILQILVTELMAVNLKSHKKRSLAFPKGSSIGYLAAVAVPIDLLSRNVFLSFNLETNFGLLNNNTHSDLIEKWNLDSESNFDYNNVTTITRRSLKEIFTRKIFYETLEGHLSNFGLNGFECLLRIICEINEIYISENNGLLGTLLHILLSPTTSTKEAGINLEYYQAEDFGLKKNCSVYYQQCPVNILDMISQKL